jgi:hypothetical protein
MAFSFCHDNLNAFAIEVDTLLASIDSRCIEYFNLCFVFLSFWKFLPRPGGNHAERLHEYEKGS